MSKGGFPLLHNFYECALKTLYTNKISRGQCIKGFGNVKSMNKVQLSRLRAKFHTLPLVYSI